MLEMIIPCFAYAGQTQAIQGGHVVIKPYRSPMVVVASRPLVSGSSRSIVDKNTTVKPKKSSGDAG